MFICSETLIDFLIAGICRIFSVKIFYCNAPFTDLRKFRSYKGGSVRDLLRAMRNKASLLLCAFWGFIFGTNENKQNTFPLVYGFLSSL